MATFLRERTRQLVERYKSDIMEDRQLRVGRVYEAVSEIACPRIEVNGVKFHHFRCVLRDCSECKNQYKPVSYKSTSE